MTSLLDAPSSVMDVLRGERDSRPPADRTSAAGLRSQLEDGLFSLLGADLRATPVTLRASSLHQRLYLIDNAQFPLAQARGILVNYALRLLAAGNELSEPFGDAMSAWRVDAGNNDLLDAIDYLENDERARLVTEFTAHFITLRRSLGTLSSRWLPRTSLRAHQRLGGGNVILRDVVDLMVGTTSSEEASVALLDVTTSPLSEGAERVMRYHALVQTLRTSLVPLRTSMFSTSTGELWSLNVDHELLQRSVHEVLEVVAAIELRA